MSLSFDYNYNIDDRYDLRKYSDNTSVYLTFIQNLIMQVLKLQKVDKKFQKRRI